MTRMKTNSSMGVIQFWGAPIRVIYSSQEAVEWLCLNDLLKVLDRTCMMDNGTAMKLCRTSFRIPFKDGGRNRWGVKPHDVHNLLRVVQPENAIVGSYANGCNNGSMSCLPQWYRVNGNPCQSRLESPWCLPIRINFPTRSRPTVDEYMSMPLRWPKDLINYLRHGLRSLPRQSSDLPWSGTANRSRWKAR